MSWSDWVLWGCAVSGAGLGLYNAWRAQKRDQVNLDVRVAEDEEPRFLGIEIINKSSFPVDIIEIGVKEDGNFRPVKVSEIGIGPYLPVTLLPRTLKKIQFGFGAATALGTTDNPRPYAITACGKTVVGEKYQP